MSAPVQPLRLPVLLPACAAWVVCGWATARTPGACWAVAAVAGALGVVAAAALVRRREGAALAVLALVCGAACAAAASCGAALSHRDRGPVRAWAGERAIARVDAVVARDPRLLAPPRAQGPGAGEGPRAGQERWLVTVSTEQVTARGRTWSGGVTLLVFTPSRWPSTVGSHVRLVGRLSPVDGVGEATAAMAVSSRPEHVRPPNGIWRLAAALRQGLRQASSGGSAGASGLLPALVVGDTEALPPQVEAAMRASGLTHLTAVSGANLAVLLGAVLFAAAILRIPRRLRLLLGGCCVVLFVVIARPEPSVVRAAAMGSVAIVGLFAGRTLTGLHALTVAVLCLLIWNPWLSRSPGLALSAAATAGLLTLSRPLSDRLPVSWPRSARLAVAAAGAAQCVTVPIVLLLHDGVSLVALPANLVAGPAAAAATVSGSLALALSPASAGLAHVAARPGLWAADLICHVATVASGVPGATLPWPQGRAGAMAAALGAAAAVLAVAAAPRRAPRRRGRRRRQRIRPRRALVLRGAGRASLPMIVASGVATAALIAAGWLAAPYVPVAGTGSGAWPPTGWSAVQCDVGQGHATVLRTGPGAAVLVDAGPDPDLVDRCLRRLAVTRLDLVVMTHFHGDHVLGLPGALRGRRATAAVVSPLAQPADTAEAVGRWLAGAGVPVMQGWAGKAGSAGGLRWTVLSPAAPLPEFGSGDAGGSSADDDGSMINDASTVVLFQTAARSYLVLGDLEEAGQRGLLRAWPGNVQHVDVVTVAHHGSPHQDPALYRRIGASVALVGVGSNDYGHPSPRTTAMLATGGAMVVRTDRFGDIAVVERSDGALAVATQRGAAAAAAGTCASGAAGPVCPDRLAGLARAPREPIPLSLGAPAQARLQSRRRAGGPHAGAGRPGRRRRGPSG